MLFLAGCGNESTNSPAAVAGEVATATTHPYFDNVTPVNRETASAKINSGDESADGVLKTPTIAELFLAQEPPTPVPTRTPASTSTPAPTRTPAPELFTSRTVFDDELDPDWSTDESWDITGDLEATKPVHKGRHAIEVAPRKNFGSLFFTVREEAKRVFLRSEVLGISFWLHGGERGLDLDELAVSVIGSHEYPYWVENDKSVDFAASLPSQGGDNKFSETELHFLGFNDAIPPNTWVEVVIWLDELIYDPDYTYVTGFYIKSGESLQDSFYIDDASLIVLDGS